ncbi:MULTISPECIES: serine hydrolase [unclassified Carboxylicivirga]|uniref:serine hydrolase domain-containing protein n=1 Tax=Carboxylicivirga TaxID=1628153 RepID=UPI003D33E6C1
MKRFIPLAFIPIFITSCTTLYRGARYWDADITDHQIFPFTEINPGDSVFHFAEGNTSIFDTLKISYRTDTAKLLNQIIEPSSTHAFIVIRNDSILFENYYEGYQRSDISTLFSVSKSVTSLLMGIAIDEGYIESVDDPITKYIPELKGKDPNFEKLTLQHLLDMRSGTNYNDGSSNPFSHIAKLYYGTNQLAKLKRLKFEHEPGEVHNYQSSSTALLGIAIEKATGKELGKYLEEKVWLPMGMEYRATWSVDDRRHRSAKAYCGLNATAIDLAKIGRLYLNKGVWNGKQIVSKEWIKRAETPIVENDGYRNQWWSIDANATDSLGSYYFPDSLSAVRNMTELYKNKYKHYLVWKDEQAPDATKPWRIVVYTGTFRSDTYEEQYMRLIFVD